MAIRRTGEVCVLGDGEGTGGEQGDRGRETSRRGLGCSGPQAGRYRGWAGTLAALFV